MGFTKRWFKNEFEAKKKKKDFSHSRWGADSLGIPPNPKVTNSCTETSKQTNKTFFSFYNANLKLKELFTFYNANFKLKEIFYFSTKRSTKSFNQTNLKEFLQKK
jgi:hypothetical protein